jgi:glycosyltransferase involved in cell wall biosynthesis
MPDRRKSRGVAIAQRNGVNLREQSPEADLASIIIPAYFAARFLPTALADVEQQTWRQWEVIVVEDGSRDGAEQIVGEFAKQHRDHRVVYHRLERNGGLGVARNTAMGLAHGEYIAFLDADDRWKPNHLQLAIQALQTSGAQLAYSTVELFDDISGGSFGTWGPTDHDLAVFPESLFLRNFIQPSATVVRQEVLRAVGGFCTVDRAGVNDLDYWLRSIEAGQRFVYVDQITCLYRKNHTEAMTAKVARISEGVARVLHSHMFTVPGGRGRRRRVAKHYARAAWHHLAPVQDASAEPANAPRLLARAWRLRPDRIDYLAMATLAQAIVSTGMVEQFRPFWRKRLAA